MLAGWPKTLTADSGAQETVIAGTSEQPAGRGTPLHGAAAWN